MGFLLTSWRKPCCTELSAVSYRAEKKDEILVNWTQRTYDSAAMRMARSILAPTPVDVTRQRAAAYFTLAGYRQRPDSDGCIRFTRGSIAGSATNFDPTRWGCVVNFRVIPDGNTSRVDLEVTIAADPFERRFAKELLAAEFSGVEAAIAGKAFTAVDTGDLRRRVASHVYRVVGLFAGVMFPAILGVLAGAFVLNRLSAALPAVLGVGGGVFVIFAAICLAVWYWRTKHQALAR